jgi:hypothetical protein
VTLRHDGIARQTSDVVHVSAGARLNLHAVASFHQRSRQAVIGVQVWSVARNLSVYDTTTDLVGLPPFNVEAGTSIALDLALDVHLGRGVYEIVVHAYDMATTGFISPPRSVATFVVGDTKSQDHAIANLYLRAMLVARTETQDSQVLV